MLAKYVVDSSDDINKRLHFQKKDQTPTKNFFILKNRLFFCDCGALGKIGAFFLSQIADMFCVKFVELSASIEIGFFQVFDTTRYFL